MEKYNNRIVAGIILGFLILMSVVPAMAEEPSIILYQRSPIPAGGLESIAWNYTGSFEPNVTLELFKDGILNRTIISETNIDLGICDWAIPLSLEAGIYQIKITGNTTSGSEVTNTTDLEITTATSYGCRGCHYENPYTHHVLMNPGSQYSCVDCHPVMNGTLFIDRNCLNCHNGTAFWASPIVNPGEPHLVETPPVINSVTLSANTPNTGDLILVTVNVTDNTMVASVSVGNVLLTKRNADIWNGSIVAIEGTHQLIISAYDVAGFETMDQSNWYTATTPVITLNMTSTIQAGSMIPIQWNFTGYFEPNVTLELFKDGILKRTIISDTNIDLSICDWAIPLSLEAGIYQIKITGNTTSGSEVTNTTDLEITTATSYGCRGCHYENPYTHHVLMNPGSQYSCVDCHPVMNGTLFIDRNCLNCHNGTAFWASPIVNPGEPHLEPTPPVINRVTLSTNTPNTDALILVTVNATDHIGVISVTANGVLLTRDIWNGIWNGSITAIEGTHSVNVSVSNGLGLVTSDNSTSYTATTPNIIVTSPMTGNNWRRGTTHTIVWTYTGNLGSSATIELLEQGEIRKTWTNVPQANGVGSLEWAIPSRFETSTYKIRVSAGGYSNTTGDFNIVRR